MTRTRTRYDIREGDLLHITCWYRDTDSTVSLPANEIPREGRQFEVFLVTKDYGPWDDDIVGIDYQGVSSITMESYVIDQYRPENEDS